MGIKKFISVILIFVLMTEIILGASSAYGMEMPLNEVETKEVETTSQDVMASELSKKIIEYVNDESSKFQLADNSTDPVKKQTDYKEVEEAIELPKEKIEDIKDSSLLNQNAPIESITANDNTAISGVQNKFTISGYIAPDFMGAMKSAYLGFKIEIIGTGLSAETNEEGFFTISGDADSQAKYILQISKAGYLKRQIGDLTLGGLLSLGSKGSPVKVWAGDIPNKGVQDDTINMSDVIQIALNFNKIDLSTDLIKSCDLNCDGSINMADVIIMARHFNATSALYEKVTVTIKEYEKPLAPTELKSLWNTGTAISLAWTRPTAGMATESYEVYSNDKVIATTKQTTIVCAGLTPNQLNKLYVKSVSAEGGKSDSSNVLEIQAPEDDHGNTKENATPIELEKEISGVFHDSDDYDYFTFVPKKTGIYVIKIYNSYYTPEFYNNEGYPCGSGTNNDYHFEAGKVYYLRTGTENNKDYRFIVRLKTNKPDLIFGYTSRNKCLAGQPVDFKHVVTNIGDTTSKGSFKVGITVSGENNNYIAECTTDIEKDRDCSVGPMLDAAGNQWIPNAPGEYLVTFNIDSENKIDEANEENNKITLKFYVDDYADSASGAKEINIGQDVKGYLSTYTDTDYFVFIPKKTGKYRFTIFKNNISFFADFNNIPTFRDNTQIFIQGTFIQGRSYYIYVCDYYKKINTNEEYTIISKEIAPDLTISKVDLIDNKNGEPCKLRAEISNVGDEVLESGRFRVGFTAENQKKTFYTDYYEGSVTFKSIELFISNADLNSMLKTNGFHKIKVFIEKSTPFNEADEANNSIDTTVGFYSDLIITDMIFPYECTTKEPIAAKVVVKNIGQRPTQALYPVIVSMDIDGIDTKYYTNCYLKQIQPDQSVTLAVYDDSGNSPQIHEKGIYKVQASLDEYYQDNDMYKENNSISKFLNVDIYPDLIVNDIILDPPNPVDGEKVQLKAKIKNISEYPISPSKDCKVGFKIDDNDILHWTDMPPGLKPGEKAIVTGWIDQNNRTWDAKAGEHKVTAVVDVHDNVKESDENNNTFEKSFIVKEKCKLKIEDIILDPPNPAIGEKVTLKARLRNTSIENSPYGRIYKVGFKINDGTEIRTESLIGTISGGNYVVLSTDGINQNFWTPKNEGTFTISAILDESVDNKVKSVNVTKDKVFEAEADYDNDGLSNEKEKELKTDWNEYDTDDDSICDGDEVNGKNGYKTDPLNPDTDEDGTYDNIEVKLGKSPVNKDDFTPMIVEARSQSESVVVEVYGNNTLESSHIEVNELNNLTLESMDGIIANPVDIILEDGNFKEATISFNYDEANLNGIPEEELTVYWLDYESKTFVQLPDYNIDVDTYNNIITAKVNHFSTYVPGKKNLKQIKCNNSAVFVIDESGSMDDDNQQNSINIAAMIVEKSNELSNEFAVVKFSEVARTLVDLSTNKQSIIDAIKSNGLGGGTNIASGLKEGESILLSSKNGKYVILISDGADSNFDGTVAFAKTMAIEGISIISVAIAGYSQVLNEAANITGGVCYTLNPAAANVEIQMSNIASQIIELLNSAGNVPPEKKGPAKKIPSTIPNETYGCINWAGDIDAYEFTPAETKLYCISSIGETDTEINVYDSKGKLISSSDNNDDSEWDKNFYILMNLTKGQKYRFEVNHSDVLNGTGEYKICVSDPIKEKLGPDQAYLKLLAYEMEGTYTENPTNKTVDVTINGETRTFSKISFVNGQVVVDIKDFLDAFGIMEMYAAPGDNSENVEPGDVPRVVSTAGLNSADTENNKKIQEVLSGLGCLNKTTAIMYREIQSTSRLYGYTTQDAVKKFQTVFMGKTGNAVNGRVGTETAIALDEYLYLFDKNPAFLKSDGVNVRAYLEYVYKLIPSEYKITYDGKNIEIQDLKHPSFGVSKIFIPELKFNGKEGRCYAKVRNIKYAYKKFNEGAYGNQDVYDIKANMLKLMGKQMKSGQRFDATDIKNSIGGIDAYWDDKFEKAVNNYVKAALFSDTLSSGAYDHIKNSEYGALGNNNVKALFLKHWTNIELQPYTVYFSENPAPVKWYSMIPEAPKSDNGIEITKDNKYSSKSAEKFYDTYYLPLDKIRNWIGSDTGLRRVWLQATYGVTGDDKGGILGGAFDEMINFPKAIKEILSSIWMLLSNPKNTLETINFLCKVMSPIPLIFDEEKKMFSNLIKEMISTFAEKFGMADSYEKGKMIGAAISFVLSFFVSGVGIMKSLRILDLLRESKVLSKVCVKVAEKAIASKEVLAKVIKAMAEAIEQITNILLNKYDQIFEIVKETVDYGTEILFKMRTGVEVRLQKSVLKAKGILDDVLNYCVTGCFVGDVIVTTKDGLKRIDQIQEGEYVLSKDVKTGIIDYKEVKQVYIKSTYEIVCLKLNDEEIRTTASHLFFTNSGWWKAAENLRVGDKILNSKGEYKVLIGKSVETLKEPERVYNLNVDNFHTYFVGTNGLLVHNNCYEEMMKVFNDAVELAKIDGVTDPLELAAIGKAAAKSLIDKFDWGSYLKGLIGNPPVGMKRPHAHHILFKEGLGDLQKALVDEGQKILYSYGLDPIKGVENLVWAPNIKGQHTTAALERVVSELRNLYNIGATKEQVVRKLQQLGKEAAEVV